MNPPADLDSDFQCQSTLCGFQARSPGLHNLLAMSALETARDAQSECYKGWNGDAPGTITQLMVQSLL